VAAMFLDKWKTFEAFAAAGLPFARSVLPSRYDHAFGAIIVKPREGRGSRDLHFNPPRPDLFDDAFVVQELLSGDELTIAAYVTAGGTLHGFIVLRRFLQAGATSSCETVSHHDAKVETLLLGMLRSIRVRGSFNVQAIACADGSIIPFEVNGRVSGTASIRHHFGFRDVEYLLSEFVWKRPLEPVRITPGSAMRYLADVIYPGLDLESARDRKTPHLVF
jgi:carbamoyl-phosphate synthase large subunit